ncbi:MAG: thiamine biosynthesis lipoprotein [Polaribacter sp.]|jgi:thiamine biosynthesis lipoprotein
MPKQFLYFLLLLVPICSCQQQSPAAAPSTEAPPTAKAYNKLQGKTMGTTWHITYAGDNNTLHQKNIDSLLIRLNEEVSTYIPAAIISQFNQSEKGVQLDAQEHAHFLQNLKAAQKINKETQQQFDPTVMPLVNYWGFGYTGRGQVKEADKQKVKALLSFVGMDHVTLNENGFLSKDNPQVQIDFSALAKGYGVDEICRYFDQQNISDYFVEIGGEVNTKGRNPAGILWSVGISRPEIASAPNDFYLIIKLDNKAVATSGNYRNVYLADGVYYSHTIDPITGFSKRDRLLSASVLTKDCMLADAYATSFMVMGLEKSMAFAKAHPELGLCLIYNTADGKLDYFVTENMKDFVIKVE